MATELRKLKIRRVALVDKGANQEAFVTLFKRDDAEEVQHMDDQEAAVVEPVAETVSKADLEAAIAKAEAEKAEIRKAMEAVQAEAETAKAELAKRDEATEIAKFDAEAKDVPFLGDKGGVWLRSISKALGDEYAAFRTALLSAAAVEQDSALLQELGTPGTGEDADFNAVATQVAKTIMKDQPQLTREQAYVKALESAEVKAAYARDRGGRK